MPSFELPSAELPNELVTRLPNELVTSVASYVGPEESCRTMSRICKSWRIILLSASDLWYDFAMSAALTNTGPYHISFTNSAGSDLHQPPWVSDDASAELTFAESALVNRNEVEEEEVGTTYYEMWRAYALAEEEYELGYLRFLNSSENAKRQIENYLKSNMVVQTCRIFALTLWLMTTIQFGLLLSGGSIAFAPSILIGVQIVLPLWWLVNVVPFAIRYAVEQRFKQWLMGRRQPQPDGFFTMGSKNRRTWRRVVHVGAFPSEFRLCQIMRRQETAMILTIACHLTTMHSSAWSIALTGVLAVLWYLVTAPRTTHTREEAMCPVSLSILGYLCVLIIVACLPFVINGWSLSSVFPLLAPYVVASAALWLETVNDLQPSINRIFCPDNNTRVGCAPCIRFCCFPCADLHRSCCIASLLGVVTLWTTGILALLWTEFLLYPDTAPIIWTSTHISPITIILLPLSFNLFFLGLAAIAV